MSEGGGGGAVRMGYMSERKWLRGYVRGRNSLDPIVYFIYRNKLYDVDTQFPTNINSDPELPTFWAIL